MGYSGENAIPTNFQRVPPWPDGWYQLFPVIVVEIWHCPGNATSANMSLLMQICTYGPVHTSLRIQICTYEPVRASLYIQKSVRANLYTRVCTSRPVPKILYTRVCTYKAVPTGLKAYLHHLAWAWRIAIHKTPFFYFSIAIATESARVCTQIPHCTFMDYSGENAIPTNFQRVPPWPDGWYQLFPVIVAEISYCPGKARPQCTSLYVHICTACALTLTLRRCGRGKKIIMLLIHT